MTILVADDHAIVRKGLVQLLSEEFPSSRITEVSNSGEVIHQLSLSFWDVILLDISMPGRNGVDTLKQIRKSNVRTPVLMLSAHSEEQYAIRVLKAGASGFLCKNAAPEMLLEAVHRVLTGRKFVSPSIAEKLADSIGQSVSKTGYGLLSDRELQVVERIAAGSNVSDIAIDLSLSVNTISTYRARILEKLGLKNNAAITRYALDNDLTG